ncbi:MAG: hypothetical protein AAF789_01625, partial [Bacteroidota bacterium]
MNRRPKFLWKEKGLSKLFFCGWRGAISLVFFLSLSILSCKNQPQSSTEPEPLSDKISELLGNSFSVETKGEFSLCSRKLENGWTEFLIANTTSNSITYGPEKLNG